MKRGFLVVLTLVAFALTFSSLLGGVRPAFADGALTITNSTVDRAVMVEVRQGSSTADAVPAATQSLTKGQTLRLDPTNLQYFWRREINPGSGDGKWTDWQRVDPRSGDQSVQF
jgi:hypothetical protein